MKNHVFKMYSYLFIFMAIHNSHISYESLLHTESISWFNTVVRNYGFSALCFSQEKCINWLIVKVVRHSWLFCTFQGKCINWFIVKILVRHSCSFWAFPGRSINWLIDMIIKVVRHSWLFCALLWPRRVYSQRGRIPV